MAKCLVRRTREVGYQFVGSCLDHAVPLQKDAPHHKSVLSPLLLQCRFAAGNGHREKKSVECEKKFVKIC